MNKRLMSISIIMIIAVLVLSSLIVATPEGPAIIKNGESRHTLVAGKELNTSNSMGAFAGNITFLNISAVGLTRTWAAYAGNVTGTLVMENSGGNRLYEWNMTSPGGKVMATNDTITDWANIYCWNWSVATNVGLSNAEWETKYGVTNSDSDTVNATFNAGLTYTTFYIGNKEFDEADEYESGGSSPELCPAIRLFNGSSIAAVGQYEEIILQAGNWTGTAQDDPALIYVSLIEPTGIGFDGGQIDFQMIVPDDGHLTDEARTDYYFYVEIEAGDYS